METTHNLKHVIKTTDIDGNTLHITIRLGDDSTNKCNGHADFAITGFAWEKGKGRSISSELYGGCCHDEILKVRPDLKLFVDLHLADSNGVPMYAIANGFYHLKNSKKDVARDYVRATEKEFEQLAACPDQDYFGFMLAKMGIPARWKEEANQAIAMLEDMTGKKFVDDSKKSNWDWDGKIEKMKEIEQLVNDGFYTPDQIQERKLIAEKDKQIADFQEIVDERDQAIQKANNKYVVQHAVLSSGLPLKNFIYYDHSNEGAFNWNTSSYNPAITQEQFDAFLEKVKYSNLPSGIVFKMDKRK